jgi:SAM-dependent methyltransferase
MTRSASHVRRNRKFWEAASDGYQEEHRGQLNRWDRPVWGVWGIPESRLRTLGDVRGLDVLEYGCGGGQWSIWFAKSRARPVGLDLSFRQLEHARRLMDEAGVRFPIVHGDAERTPFADESFDLVFCDHGAMTFADPDRTVPEASRLLRPGGRLVFNIASAFHSVCWDDAKNRVSERLLRDYFGMRAWVEETVDFVLPYGEWIRLFREHDLEVEDLVELRPPTNARTTYPWYAPLEWARRFPGENIWKVRKRG